MRFRNLWILLVAPVLVACDGDKDYAGFSCRASNIQLGECLNSNGIVGHEHRVIAKIIFEGDYKYRVYPQGDQCMVDYTIDTERNGRAVKKEFSCAIPDRK